MSAGLKKKVVIFDFDGTLADTEDILRNIYIDIAREKKWKPLNSLMYRKLLTASIWDAARWAGFRPWRLAYLVNESRKRLRDGADKVKIFDGLKEVIKKLDAKDYKIYVLSRNWQNTVQAVVDNNGLSDFLIVLEKPGFFSKHKSVRKLLLEKKYQNNQTWMIGDEVRDLYAAKRAGVLSIAVTWGFQDEKILNKFKPTGIAKKPSDIIKIIDS